MNNSEVPLDKLLTLTVAQAAALCGIHRDRLDQAIRAGQLSVMTIPGVKRIARKELDRWIDSMTVNKS